MPFIDDLIAAGLPFSPDGERLRELSNNEQLSYQAIKIKYMPDNDRDAALKKRPDLAARLVKIQAEIDAAPERADFKDRYQAAPKRLQEIIDNDAMTNAQAAKAIRDMARMLLGMTRLIYKSGLLTGIISER